jgi:hypothetical protein
MDQGLSSPYPISWDLSTYVPLKNCKYIVQKHKITNIFYSIFPTFI